MQKKIITLPMFLDIEIIYMEGTPEEAFKETEKVAKRCGLKMTLPIKEFQKPAGMTYGLPREKDLDPKTGKVPPIMIYVNTTAGTRLRDGEKKSRNIVIPHEVSHAVRRLTKKLGIDDSETSAYLTGYLCGEFL